MARVRRNSHNSRRRHTLEQTEGQRSIRPKAATNESQAPGIQQPILCPAPVVGTTVNYRGVPPPPQLVTSIWPHRQHTYPDVRSPESLGSTDHQTPGHNAFDSSSFASYDRNRTHSPLEYTPTHSASSWEPSASQDGLSAFLTSRKRSDSGSTNFLDRTLHHGALILCCVSV